MKLIYKLKCVARFLYWVRKTLGMKLYYKMSVEFARSRVRFTWPIIIEAVDEHDATRVFLKFVTSVDAPGKFLFKESGEKKLLYHAGEFFNEELKNRFGQNKHIGVKLKTSSLEIFETFGFCIPVIGHKSFVKNGELNEYVVHLIPNKHVQWEDGGMVIDLTA